MPVEKLVEVERALLMLHIRVSFARKSANGEKTIATHLDPGEALSIGPESHLEPPRPPPTVGDPSNVGADKKMADTILLFCHSRQ